MKAREKTKEISIKYRPFNLLRKPLIKQQNEGPITARGDTNMRRCRKGKYHPLVKWGF